ncbi:MAG: single-stranded-DNA-specific exonuclease RecJ [Omnitrophica bacterium RIFCSPLOWO2_01_FULL_45_24]|nr:MAG: single-stranded-DNA-specific exonuclease RecJ [Omnitrophica bacterium RIFCSPLOWO2_01_FULL_45_24]
MRKIWRIKDPNLAVQKNFYSELKISKITAQLLSNRGIDNAKEAAEFLACSLSSCHDPFLLKDMEKAAARIKKAIRGKENILIYGDYDVDGMTSAALLYTALKHLGAIVETYIPNRLEEGYGLNVAAIKKAYKNGMSLIVTVDCGIGSFKEIEYARAFKIDVIVTDHHEIVGSRLPPAYAIINPLQESCEYPFKHLAGVGLAYKLAKALYEGTSFFAEDFLDLVSLGTIADIVPLKGENRILAKHGLDEINKRNRVGLEALTEASGLSGKDVSSGHIGFILGPRINAMGRVGSPQKALELLLTDDKEEAMKLAKTLNDENRNRQKIESGILEEALSKIEREVNFKHHKVIVLGSEKWHPGVIGIVASRIADRYYRPTILVSLDGKFGKGSGRSVEDFNLFKALSKCRDLLVTFGGHESACGITIEKDRIDAFREKINIAAGQDVNEQIFSPRLDIDMDIPLNMLTEDIIGEIESLAPFGEENPRPVFSSRNLIIKDGPRQIGRNGFKMWVTDNAVTCEAVSFGRGGLEPPNLGSGVDLAYIPSINNWQGVQSIQLELKDIKPFNPSIKSEGIKAEK